ncbi:MULTISPECIES: alcohol dehydrogenase catalytic domain-containing protein [unclassified Streptomyces]|uniref:alcohol dehydrogenase catalytic domain-containing protein n=1 Tax=unclassified Streptomyces TaxID=2593676 RepID=UPI0035A84101
MKACGVSGADGDVVLLELPEPPSPGPGQVLLEVEAAEVGPWDRSNDAGWDVGLRPPAALGVEGVGRVLAIGADGFGGERALITAAHAAACPQGLNPVLAEAQQKPRCPWCETACDCAP